jgi:hypothetical protein
VAYRRLLLEHTYYVTISPLSGVAPLLPLTEPPISSPCPKTPPPPVHRRPGHHSRPRPFSSDVGNPHPLTQSFFLIVAFTGSGSGSVVSPPHGQAHNMYNGYCNSGGKINRRFAALASLRRWSELGAGLLDTSQTSTRVIY